MEVYKNVQFEKKTGKPLKKNKNEPERAKNNLDIPVNVSKNYKVLFSSQFCFVLLETNVISTENGEILV